MFRISLYITCLFALIITPISSPRAFDMEGMIHSDPRTKVAAIDIQAQSALPDAWNCYDAKGTVRVRGVNLCPVMAESAADKPRPPREIRYRVLIEQGLEVQADEFVTRVGTILNGETGWGGRNIKFVRVAKGFNLSIVLATPESVDRLCRPLRTRGWLSCAMAGRAIINADRWQGGAETWGTDVAGYHHYLINHEVGHVLGMRHLSCPQQGAPAPIMLPQTRFLKGCTANGKATRYDIVSLDRALSRFERRLNRPYTRRARRSSRRTRRRYRRRARLSRRASLRRKRSRRRRRR